MPLPDETVAPEEPGQQPSGAGVSGRGGAPSPPPDHPNPLADPHADPSE
ncbi:hypothetical protein ACFWP2_16450 [Kitasatospora sp. NPDC058444]